MATEQIITLSITETAAPAPPTFLCDVWLDDSLLLSNQELSRADAQNTRDLAHQFNALFEQHRQPQQAADNLAALGTYLFHTWLAAAWPTISAGLSSGAHRTLVIASDSAAILNLPWELLRLPDSDALGFDAKYGIRRLPHAGRLQPAAGTPPPRPLRILFMACSPEGVAVLDYEREEAAVLQAIARVGPNVVFDSCDLGTFDELQERIVEFEPQIVHLTGHGVVLDDGLGYFAFEDERGKTDLRSSEEIRRELFAGSSVQCAFISGCQSGKAPPVAAIGGICQGLVSEEVPLAIGWAASIADNLATQFAETLYRMLSRGDTMNQALTKARLSIREICEERGDPSWVLPVLYAATAQQQVFDRHAPPAALPERRSIVQQPLAGMAEGYTRHFVGRRRELQRLLPALREGSIQAVLLTGLGGAGKSTLATHLARKLEVDGYRLIPIPSSNDAPLSAARLLEHCGDAFLAAGLRDAHATVRDASIEIGDRLRYIVTVLNEHRFLLVLDNFESNLDEATRTLKDPGIAAFYRYLLPSLVGNSRAIITCRYLPADPPRLPITAHHEPLGDFPQGDFLKFLLGDPRVEERYYQSQLTQDLLNTLYRVLGGTPRFLDQVRTLLATIPTEELRSELAQVQLPAADEPGKLRALQEEYFQDIITARLYSYLDPAAQKALSRAAVYSIPVIVEGLAAVTDESEDRVRSHAAAWQSYALAHTKSTESGDLWLVYSLLRGWLLHPDRLSEDERRQAHQAAGDFLRELVDQRRQGKLGLSSVDCLLEARSQYLAAGEYERARILSGRVTGAYIRQGSYRDVIRLNQELLEYEEHPNPMSWIGRAYADLARYGEARRWYERALAAVGEALPGEASTAWHGLATIDVHEGNYSAARQNFQRSLTIEQEIGDRAGEAATWHNLATIDVYEGNYSAARQNFQRSLTIKQEIEDRAGEAASWHQLAMIDMHEGNYPAARQNFQRSLTIEQEFGNRAGEAATWHGLASIDLEEGNYSAARQSFQRALTMRQEIGDRAGEAATWHNLASIDLEEGNYPAARQNFQRSLTINQEIGDRAGEGATFAQLGGLAAQLGRSYYGARLAAVSLLILQGMGHGDAQRALAIVSHLAQQLDYSQAEFEAMISEAVEAYNTDRCAALIRVVFAEDGQTDQEEQAP
jgi:tetratricopeptide (TPR) repeat protein